MDIKGGNADRGIIHVLVHKHEPRQREVTGQIDDRRIGRNLDLAPLPYGLDKALADNDGLLRQHPQMNDIHHRTMNKGR